MVLQVPIMTVREERRQRMTDEKKLILMTKAALCRQQEQERDLQITKFYKRD